MIVAAAGKAAHLGGVVAAYTPLPIIGVPTRMTFMIKAIIFLVVVLITCRQKSGPLPR